MSDHGGTVNSNPIGGRVVGRRYQIENTATGQACPLPWFAAEKRHLQHRNVACRFSCLTPVAISPPSPSPPLPLSRFSPDPPAGPVPEAVSVTFVVIISGGHIRAVQPSLFSFHPPLHSANPKRPTPTTAGTAEVSDGAKIALGGAHKLAGSTLNLQEARPVRSDGQTDSSFRRHSEKLNVTETQYRPSVSRGWISSKERNVDPAR